MSEFEVHITSLAQSFNGKTAIVTGAGSGIGLCLAQQLAAAGATVFGMDRAYVGDDTQIPDGRIEHLQGDVTDEDCCRRIARYALESTQRLDILVNCAGVAERTRRTVRQDSASWQHTMDVNLKGCYFMSKAAASTMCDIGAGGSIVNLSSITGLVGFRASNAYGVSKAAVAMLTKTMASDLADARIRVNAVAPGFIETPMTADLQSMGKISADGILSRIPMGHLGTPLQVVLPILMLCSSWAEYITGAVVTIDGGWTALGGI